MEVYETTNLRPLHKLKFLLLVLCGRHLVDDDFPVSSQHLDSGRYRTVRLPSVDVDCCVPCSIVMPTRTQNAGCAAAAALTAPSSQVLNKSGSM